MRLYLIPLVYSNRSHSCLIKAIFSLEKRAEIPHPSYSNLVLRNLHFAPVPFCPRFPKHPRPDRLATVHSYLVRMVVRYSRQQLDWSLAATVAQTYAPIQLYQVGVLGIYHHGLGTSEDAVSHPDVSGTA